MKTVEPAAPRRQPPSRPFCWPKNCSIWQEIVYWLEWHNCARLVQVCSCTPSPPAIKCPPPAAVHPHWPPSAAGHVGPCVFFLSLCHFILFHIIPHGMGSTVAHLFHPPVTALPFWPGANTARSVLTSARLSLPPSSILFTFLF